MKSSPSCPADQVAQAIRATGARVTWPRQRTLALLQAAQEPLSHHEIESALLQSGQTGIDRVTLYRVLDWLVRQGLAHRAVDHRGVFRFSPAKASCDHESHIHFRCTDCGKVVCLDSPPPQQPQLPRGFRLTAMTVDVRGQCPHCTGEQD